MAAKTKQTRKVIDTADAKKAGIMIEALEDMTDKFNNWEAGFFENIYDWFITKGGSLSPAQFESLERIYRKFF